MNEFIHDEGLKLLGHALGYLLALLGGWMCRAVWKLHKDVTKAEERLEIDIPKRAMRYFGWVILPLRVARVERNLGLANGKFLWRLVRTKRVNKCFEEIRKNGHG